MTLKAQMTIEPKDFYQRRNRHLFLHDVMPHFIGPCRCAWILNCVNKGIHFHSVKIFMLFAIITNRLC